jgi:esterase FrsA
MAPANLTETLFKPSFNYPETSTLVRRVHRNREGHVNSTLDGEVGIGWYRLINRLVWLWRGLDAMEMEEVMARIAMSSAPRSDDNKLDTVIGYRSGNWVYEWSQQGMLWQQRAMETRDQQKASDYWLMAANFYSIAGYPHLKGDTLAEQAELLANKAFTQSADASPYGLKEIPFAIPGGATVSGFLHMPNIGKAPFPTVLMCGGLDTLQSDYHQLFKRYLAARGIAMLTLDMPSIGFSSRWKLSHDSSFLHQHVIAQLHKIPWIDHLRTGVFGFRFGANVAVRLAYLEAHRIRAVACLGPIVHGLLCNVQHQQQLPDMFMDILASRLGMSNTSNELLQAEMNHFSLKVQGLLGRNCPTPLLSGYWQNDKISTKEESRLIVGSSAQGQLLEIPANPLFNSFEKALNEICQWLQDKIC